MLLSFQGFYAPHDITITRKGLTTFVAEVAVGQVNLWKFVALETTEDEDWEEEQDGEEIETFFIEKPLEDLEEDDDEEEEENWEEENGNDDVEEEDQAEADDVIDDNNNNSNVESSDVMSAESQEEGDASDNKDEKMREIEEEMREFYNNKNKEEAPAFGIM